MKKALLFALLLFSSGICVAQNADTWNGKYLNYANFPDAGQVGLLLGTNNSYTNTITGFDATRIGQWLGLGSAAYQPATNFSLYDGWATDPGQDANSMSLNKVNFTYANNAPYNGPLLHFGPQNYSMQFNSSYYDTGLISFRTRNGDSGNWLPWTRLITDNDLANETFQTITDRASSTSPGREVQFRSANSDKYLFLGGGNGYARIGAFDITSGFTDVIFDCKNVGLGIPNPAEKLDIIGNVLTTGVYPYLSLKSTGWSDRSYIQTGINLTGTASGDYLGFLNPSSKGFYFSQNGANRLVINETGNVGIGTTSPDEKLTVNGKIHAKEIKVDLTVPGPDYVFEPQYKLPALTELNNYIQTHKHLPEVPSAKEMETAGINLSEMNMLLLKKVEELTLHLIEKDRQVADLQEQMKTVQHQLQIINKTSFSHE